MSILASKDTQFSLSPLGEILWQEKVNNPVPGVAVARLQKGAHPLSPKIEVLSHEITAAHDAQALLNHFTIWVNTHFSATLEALMLLAVPQGADVKEDAVSKIAARLYDGMGIVPRGELEDLIAGLTPETRAELRAKKIRLGPVLAFMPELNKPAAIKLRAMLWCLYHDVALPPKTPADGVVSVRVEEDNPDHSYYRAIGYPLYGPRAVRIDMLDRVISCVYDHAKEGKFQARHEMAEWLGSSIADLYEVLTAMGHTKIYDPAEAPVQEIKDEGEDAVADKPKDAKPELATFRLKKGKADQQSEGRKEKLKSKKQNFKKKKSEAPKKEKRDTGPRVITAAAKVNAEDSPFAILGQLKK